VCSGAALVCIWIFKIWEKARRKYCNKGEVVNTFKDAYSPRGQHISWRDLTLRRNAFLVPVFLPVTEWAFENWGQNGKCETAWSYQCHLTCGGPFGQIMWLKRIKRERERNSETSKKSKSGECETLWVSFPLVYKQFLKTKKCFADKSGYETPMGTLRKFNPERTDDN